MNLVSTLTVVFLVLFNSTPNFENSSYIKNSDAVKIINNQFIKDINSSEIYRSFEKFLEDHFDKITHISGHFEKESKIYYYAVYGIQNNTKKIDLFEVDKARFYTETYYDFESPFQPECKKGFWGQPDNSIFCFGTACFLQFKPCYGINCPPGECRWNE